MKRTAAEGRARLRAQAEAMRADGATYPEITARLGVPKSTLSYWFGTSADRQQLRIYFIQAETGGPVKIGLATRVAYRLQKLQTGNAQRLVLRAEIPGDEDLERELHRQFAPQRVQGEWFTPTAAMEAIAGVDLGATRRRHARPAGRRPHASLRPQRRPAGVLYAAEVAEFMQLSTKTIYRQIEAGHLEAAKHRGAWWITRAAVDRWLDNCSNVPRVAA